MIAVYLVLYVLGVCFFAGGFGTSDYEVIDILAVFLLVLTWPISMPMFVVVMVILRACSLSYKLGKRVLTPVLNFIV